MRVLIEFIGGCWDGKNLDSQSADEVERTYVTGIYAMTHHGEVGRAFRGFSMDSLDQSRKKGLSMEKFIDAGASANHRYTVTDRIERDNEILIRLEYSLMPDKQ